MVASVDAGGTFPVLTVAVVAGELDFLGVKASEAVSEGKGRNEEGGGGGGKRGRRPRPLERPTEESVEKLEERLEAAQADQKNLFLIIFQRFVDAIISDMSDHCDHQVYHDPV